MVMNLYYNLVANAEVLFSAAQSDNLLEDDTQNHYTANRICNLAHYLMCRGVTQSHVESYVPTIREIVINVIVTVSMLAFNSDATLGKKEGNRINKCRRKETNRSPQQQSSPPQCVLNEHDCLMPRSLN
jgi:hypothetical protein